MTAAVFIGPSAPRALVEAHFAGLILPPVSRGDLDALVAAGDVRTVGIVDGAFYQRLAITPKEVLRALDGGVQIYGSSSMGALRAAECHPYGMVGVGRIFAMFMNGEIEADDEVALTFELDDLEATSEAMVNIRLALTWAADRDLISAHTARVAIVSAKNLYFPERGYPRILHETRSLLSPSEHERLQAFVVSGQIPDQKRIDALELLRLLGPATDDRGTGRAMD